MNATLDLLGLSPADYSAPPPAEWTPETLEVATRRLRGLAGAQIRLHAGNPSLAAGKNLVLCGHERLIGGGELLVEHVQWQVAHLHVLDGGELFDRALAALVDVDLAALPAPTAGAAPATLAATDSGWPVCQDLELVSADGASRWARVADVRRDEPLARIARGLMAAADTALRGASPFRSRGPWVGAQIEECFAQAIRAALLDTLHRDDGWFRAALSDAARGERSALERLARPWPPTNSGIERAQGAAALFLLGVAPPAGDLFAWHLHPGQPGARLRRLLHLARARPW